MVGRILGRKAMKTSRSSVSIGLNLEIIRTSSVGNVTNLIIFAKIVVIRQLVKPWQT